MFDLIAEGGQFISILALCVTSWAAGRTMGARPHSIDFPVRQSSEPASSANQSQFLRNGKAEQAVNHACFSAADRDGTFERPDDSLQADELYKLIRTGDLTQEGVLQSLVAMAEEQAETLPIRQSSMWKDGRLPLHDRDACAEPRILTRNTEATEPLPADLPDPLTPEVLSRYRIYAQDYGT